MKFLKKLCRRTNFESLYVQKANSMAVECNSPMGMRIQELKQEGFGRPYVIECMTNIMQSVSTSTSICRQTYMIMNPSLIVSQVYSDSNIPEHSHITFTLLRLSSHHLKVETGHWSRVPQEQRVCECGIMQMEEHVLLSCSLTKDIRETYPELRAVTSVRLANC